MASSCDCISSISASRVSFTASSFGVAVAAGNRSGIHCGALTTGQSGGVEHVSATVAAPSGSTTSAETESLTATGNSGDTPGRRNSRRLVPSLVQFL